MPLTTSLAVRRFSAKSSVVSERAPNRSRAYFAEKKIQKKKLPRYLVTVRWPSSKLLLRPSRWNISDVTSESDIRVFWQGTARVDCSTPHDRSIAVAEYVDFTFHRRCLGSDCFATKISYASSTCSRRRKWCSSVRDRVCVL